MSALLAQLVPQQGSVLLALRKNFTAVHPGGGPSSTRCPWCSVVAPFPDPCPHTFQSWSFPLVWALPGRGGSFRILISSSIFSHPGSNLLRQTPSAAIWGGRVGTWWWRSLKMVPEFRLWRALSWQPHPETGLNREQQIRGETLGSCLLLGLVFWAERRPYSWQGNCWVSRGSSDTPGSPGGVSCVVWVLAQVSPRRGPTRGPRIFPTSVSRSRNGTLTAQLCGRTEATLRRPGPRCHRRGVPGAGLTTLCTRWGPCSLPACDFTTLTMLWFPPLHFMSLAPGWRLSAQAYSPLPQTQQPKRSDRVWNLFAAQVTDATTILTEALSSERLLRAGLACGRRSAHSILTAALGAGSFMTAVYTGGGCEAQRG